MSSVTSVSPRTLGDVIPGGLVRSIALVIGGAVFVGLTAQVAIPLPFTPVPLTLQTFSVLLVGAALGSVRGAFPWPCICWPGSLACHGSQTSRAAGPSHLSATSWASLRRRGWSGGLQSVVLTDAWCQRSA